MAQATLYVTDANSVKQSLEETVLPDGNYAPNIILTDAAGNRIVAAPGGVGAALTSADGTKATYRYCVLGFAPVATPTDWLVIQGSAAKTLRIKRIKLTGIATANGNMPLQLIRRSAADSGGTAVLTGITAGKHDTTDPAATGVVSTVGTGNFGALGASAGLEGVGRVQLMTTATGAGVPELVWDFATRQDKALILRGVADFLCLNGNGGAVPAGAAIDIEIEIEEDAS